MQSKDDLKRVASCTNSTTREHWKEDNAPGFKKRMSMSLSHAGRYDA